ncbi:MAG TPA: hypothetical protein VHW47_07800, partial [Acidimicrobiales bacterium]|nr:hypothetical protein [Acidimicrobiales bacterium]
DHHRTDHDHDHQHHGATGGDDADSGPLKSCRRGPATGPMPPGPPAARRTAAGVGSGPATSP